MGLCSEAEVSRGSLLLTFSEALQGDFLCTERPRGSSLLLAELCFASKVLWCNHSSWIWKEDRFKALSHMKRVTSLHFFFFWPFAFVNSTNYTALPQKIVWDSFRIARHFAIFHKLKNVFNSNRDHQQHLWTLALLPERLLYFARQETACALLPFCCQKQFSLTFPLWLPRQRPERLKT